MIDEIIHALLPAIVVGGACGYFFPRKIVVVTTLFLVVVAVYRLITHHEEMEFLQSVSEVIRLAITVVIMWLAHLSRRQFRVIGRS